MTENTFSGVFIAVPQLGQAGKSERWYTRSCLLNLCYSRIDSSSDTADQRVTLANDGMLGSCATSSNILMALAALTAILSFASWSMVMESLTIFLMFLGVMFESAICCRLAVALVSLASFSCCFFSLLLKFQTPLLRDKFVSLFSETYVVFPSDLIGRLQRSWVNVNSLRTLRNYE